MSRFENRIQLFLFFERGATEFGSKTDNLQLSHSQVRTCKSECLCIQISYSHQPRLSMVLCCSLTRSHHTAHYILASFPESHFPGFMVLCDTSCAIIDHKRCHRIIVCYFASATVRARIVWRLAPFFFFLFYFE